MQQAYRQPPCHHWISLDGVIRNLYIWFVTKLRKSQQEKKDQRIQQQQSQDGVCIQSQPPTVVHIWALVDIMDGFYDNVIGFTSLCSAPAVPPQISSFDPFRSANSLLKIQSGCQQKILFFPMSVGSFFRKRTMDSNSSQQFFNCSWKCVLIRCRKMHLWLHKGFIW